MDCVWVDEPSRRGALAVVKTDFIFNFMSGDKLLWVWVVCLVSSKFKFKSLLQMFCMKNLLNFMFGFIFRKERLTHLKGQKECLWASEQQFSKNIRNYQSLVNETGSLVSKCVQIKIGKDFCFSVKCAIITITKWNMYVSLANLFLKLQNKTRSLVQG